MSVQKNSERIVICNWNYRGDRIIKELHSPQAVPDCPIVVLSEKKIETDQYYKRQYYQNVTFIYGDSTDKKVLEFVNAHLAKSVIILADDSVQDPDAKSTLIALAISKLVETKQKQHSRLVKPHISAESKNHRKIELLKDAGVDEVVCSMDYGLGLLAQSAITKNISQIYDDLLRYSQDTNEVYILQPPSADKPDIPKQIWTECFAGKTFSQASTFLSKYRNEKNPLILIGVRSNQKTYINPRIDEHGNQEFTVFNEHDKPIVISYSRPDFNLILGELATEEEKE